MPGIKWFGHRSEIRANAAGFRSCNSESISSLRCVQAAKFCTAASAKLRGLNATQTAYALGVAGSESSGVRANFGSMTKPFNAGHAADCGTQAADLASLGWTAADDILESPLGFYRAGGGGFAPAAIVDGLGKPGSVAPRLHFVQPISPRPV